MLRDSRTTSGSRKGWRISCWIMGYPQSQLNPELWHKVKLVDSKLIVREISNPHIREITNNTVEAYRSIDEMHNGASHYDRMFVRRRGRGVLRCGLCLKIRVLFLLNLRILDWVHSAIYYLAGGRLYGLRYDLLHLIIYFCYQEGLTLNLWHHSYYVTHGEKNN